MKEKSKSTEMNFTTPCKAKHGVEDSAVNYRKPTKSVLDLREVLQTPVIESLMCTGAEKRLI